MDNRTKQKMEWNKTHQKRIHLGLSIKEYQELKDLMEKKKIKYVIDVLRKGIETLKEEE